MFSSASLTQAVRNFAKGLEGWLVSSLDQVPKKMADIKVSILHCFTNEGLSTTSMIKNEILVLIPLVVLVLSAQQATFGMSRIFV